MVITEPEYRDALLRCAELMELEDGNELPSDELIALSGLIESYELETEPWVAPRMAYGC